MPRDARPPIANVFKREGARAASRPILALAAALATWPTLADSDYPPGLFENSPVVGQPGAAAPPGPTDADSADSLPPDSPESLDDYCASVAGRTFRSREEVRQAHARCDPARGGAPQPGELPDQ